MISPGLLKRFLVIVFALFMLSCNQSPRRKRKALFQLGAVPATVLFISGNNSQLKEKKAFVIQNQAQWDSLLKAHNANSEALQQFSVDFNNYSILALFSGLGFQQSYFPPKLKRIDDQIRARFPLNSIQSKSKSDKGSVYAFLVVEKTDDPFIVEEGSANQTNTDSAWKAVPTQNFGN